MHFIKIHFLITFGAVFSYNKILQVKNSSFDSSIKAQNRTLSYGYLFMSTNNQNLIKFNPG